MPVGAVQTRHASSALLNDMLMAQTLVGRYSACQGDCYTAAAM